MEKTESVDLTLEESGVLCHLLLPGILKGQKPPQFQHRMEVLYDKLSRANDKLMGK